MAAESLCTVEGSKFASVPLWPTHDIHKLTKGALARCGVVTIHCWHQICAAESYWRGNAAKQLCERAQSAQAQPNSTRCERGELGCKRIFNTQQCMIANSPLTKNGIHPRPPAVAARISMSECVIKHVHTRINVVGKCICSWMQEFWFCSKQTTRWKSIPGFSLAIFCFAQAAPSLGCWDQARFESVHPNTDYAHIRTCYTFTHTYVSIRACVQIKLDGYAHIWTCSITLASKTLSRPGPTLHARRWTSWIPSRSSVYSPQPRLSRCVFCKCSLLYIYSTTMQMWGWQLQVLTHRFIAKCKHTYAD